MKKVLFISHEASRTGAPIVLLHFLKWFKANTNIPFLILLREGGDMAPEFEALAPVINLEKEGYGKPSLFERALSRLGFQIPKSQNFFRKLNKQLAQEDIGLIYSNTNNNGDIVELLSSLKCPVITHIHELEYIIDSFLLDYYARIKRYTQKFIAVSKAVKEQLVEYHAIAENDIELIYGYIPTTIPQNLTIQQAKHQVCTRLNIPLAAFIVGASGTLNLRKGADLFIQLARDVNQRQLDTPVHFVWIGGSDNRISFAELLHDARNLGLEKYVHFTGAQPNPLEYFMAFDVFTLLSRKDPYPLVLLEAASVGKPIVCFDNSGGAKEFVEDDCGFVVPYLDVEAMADKVVKLLQSAELRQCLGQRAANKVQQRHDVAVAAPKILELIKQFI